MSRRAHQRGAAAPAPNGSSPTKRGRRTKEEMDDIRVALYSVVKADRPMTVRQCFYRMVSAGVIPKTEAQYKTTVCRLLTEMRLARPGEIQIPFGWIADNTRWQRKPITYSSLAAALRRTAEAYRRSVWDWQDVYVEIWLEKDALAGVLQQVTVPWDVPLMVTRGYPSLSYLKEAADAIERQRKPAFIYYFGDHDPSGVDIPRNVESRLREFAPGAEIHFEVVAVTPEQIERFNLPTRPTKKTDSRSKAFAGESVEVDAIPPRQLRELAEDCITRHVNRDKYDVLMLAEEEERGVLLGIGGGHREEDEL